MKALPYREGSCFALPLRQGGFAIGVVARMAPKGKIILVYLFGPMLDAVPSLPEVTSLRSVDAVKCLRIGDLGLFNCKWPIIGDLPDWRREEWPMPPFVRRDELLSKRAWRVIYSDSDPSKLESEEAVPYEVSGLEESDLYGFGAVEVLMTDILSS